MVTGALFVSMAVKAVPDCCYSVIHSESKTTRLPTRQGKYEIVSPKIKSYMFNVGLNLQVYHLVPAPALGEAVGLCTLKGFNLVFVYTGLMSHLVTDTRMSHPSVQKRTIVKCLRDSCIQCSIDTIMQQLSEYKMKILFLMVSCGVVY